ncbi:MAG: hypothetical protein ACRDSN_20125, partial [Pseudonocardiaceae bacterium]
LGPGVSAACAHARARGYPIGQTHGCRSQPEHAQGLAGGVPAEPRAEERLRRQAAELSTQSSRVTDTISVIMGTSGPTGPAQLALQPS